MLGFPLVMARRLGGKMTVGVSESEDGLHKLIEVYMGIVVSGD